MREYQLDFSIQNDTDRNEAIKQLLASLEREPSAKELEQFADYILMGKNEKNLSKLDEKEILRPTTKFNSFKSRAEKRTTSLDEAMENPMFKEDKIKPYNTRNSYKNEKPKIVRPVYDENNNLIDAGDSDIPGMVELWEIIDRWEHQLKVALGKEECYEGEVPKWRDTRNIYLLRHHLVDLHLQQYWLRDMFKPTIHFFDITSPERSWVNFASDTGYWLTKDAWCQQARKYGIEYVYNDLEERKIQHLILGKRKLPERKTADTSINLANVEFENHNQMRAEIGEAGRRKRWDELTPWDIVRLRAQEAQEKARQKAENRAQPAISTSFSDSATENFVFWKVSQNEIDYENIEHIRALIENYAKLLMKTYEFPYTYSRALCWDLERYVELADLPESRLFILSLRVAHNEYPRIQRKLLDEFGIDYSVNHIQSICRTEIPRAIANAAKKWRMICEMEWGRWPGKKCADCGKTLPMDALFFSLNRSQRDGVNKRCIECDHKRRVAEGKAIKDGIDIYDRAQITKKEDRYVKAGGKKDGSNGAEVYQVQAAEEVR